MTRLFLILLSILILSSCEKEFNPDDYGSFMDSRDGTAYKTVRIGNQSWFAENLKYLPEVNTPVKFSDTLQYYYVYDYYGTRVDRAEQTLDYKTYGVLYNFSAATGACPEGWHLPDESEWKELSTVVGEDNGSDLRSRLLWATAEKGNNTTGFNVLPAGCKENGRFTSLGIKAAFWSNGISKDFAKKAYIWGFLEDINNINNDTTAFVNAYPIRCIQD